MRLTLSIDELELFDTSLRVVSAGQTLQIVADELKPC
jgi:hypothetical protein